MFSNATRLLGLCIVCILALASSSLNAQQRTYDLNVAGINFVNIELTDNCQREVIYRNVLSGDFDVDDSGDTPTEEVFLIVVNDSDPQQRPRY